MTVRCRWMSALILLAVASPVLADKPAPPMSYKEVAPGGLYVFVMVAPGTVEEDTRIWNEQTAASIREIRRVYSQSGMYHNNGSTDPIWTVDWYADSVHPTSDGIHLVRPGPWAWLKRDSTPRETPDLDCEAVSFFANGRLLRTYRVGELVDDPDHFDQTVSHYRWEQDARFSGDFEYAITTCDGNRFAFDVRTGNIVSESRKGWVGRLYRQGRWVVISVVALVAVICFVWQRRSKLWQGKVPTSDLR